MPSKPSELCRNHLKSNWFRFYLPFVSKCFKNCLLHLECSCVDSCVVLLIWVSCFDVDFGSFAVAAAADDDINFTFFQQFLFFSFAQFDRLKLIIGFLLCINSFFFFFFFPVQCVLILTFRCYVVFTLLYFTFAKISRLSINAFSKHKIKTNFTIYFMDTTICTRKHIHFFG